MSYTHLHHTKNPIMSSFYSLCNPPACYNNNNVFYKRSEVREKLLSSEILIINSNRVIEVKNNYLIVMSVIAPSRSEAFASIGATCVRVRKWLEQATLCKTNW